LIAVFGGVVYEWETFIHLPERERSLCLQVEDRHFLVPRPIGEGDYVNHSCNPNAGLSGQIGLVAMRDIQIGEEVCFDYAMCDTMPYDEFDCLCGAPNCRRRVSGNDWQRPELQKRYAGFFSPHVQRRIDAQKAERRAFERAMREKTRSYAGKVATPSVAFK
ncbi:MAG: SET domain-containing protein-lysine N-methyltransferase, partial [Chloroflexi bacterium]